MRRDNDFDKQKVCMVSTAKTACNVYLTSFGIEQVQFQAVEYESGKRVDSYLGFDDVLLLAEDAISGRLFSRMKDNNGKLELSIGGTKSSKLVNGKPLCRIMSLGMSNDGKMIFINMQSCIGEIGKNGIIKPTNEQVTKIGVAVSINDFRKMLVCTKAYIEGYLSHLVPKLVQEAAQRREG